MSWQAARLAGAALVLLGGGAAGFGAARQVRRTQRQLECLTACIERLEGELEYRLLPVGELFAVLSRTAEEPAVGELFRMASEAMASERELSPLQALQHAMDALPELCVGQEGRQTLLELAAALGRYDLTGQGRAIALCRRRLLAQYDRLCAEKNGRCRSYGVLGVCTGLALAIILI